MDPARLKVIRLFAVLVPLSLIAVIGLAVYFWNSWLVGPSPDLSQEIAQARQEGFVLTPAELRARYAGREGNAAPLYQQAFALLESKAIPKSLKVDLLARICRDKASPEEVSEVRKALASQTDFLGLITQASRCPTCYFEHRWEGGFDGPFEEADRARATVRMLCARAHLSAGDANYALAHEDLRTAARISNHLNQCPGMIPSLTAVAAQRVVLDELVTLLQRSFPNGIAEARATFALLQPWLQTQPLWDGEIVWGRATVATIRNLKDIGKDRDEQRSLPNLPLPAAARGAADAKFIAWIRQQAAAQKTSPGDWPGQSASFAAINATTKSDRSIAAAFNRAMAGMYNRPAKTLVFLAIYKEMVEQTLNLAEAASKGAAIPDSIPPTSFRLRDLDGKPIRYKSEADGFMFYSVAEDMRDDGGAPRTPGQSRYDVRIRFHLPQKTLHKR